MLKFGYTRVSTEDQSLSLQLDALNHFGVDEIPFLPLHPARNID